MTREEHYCAGKADGERWGESDLADGLGVQHATLADLTIDGRRIGPTTEENDRAHALGLLRGYRQIVRTFEHGRWGT